MHTVIGVFVALALSQASAPQTPVAAARLAGRVIVEGTNAPVAEARVTLIPAGGPMMHPPGPFSLGTPISLPQTTTDREGRFAFSQLRPGEYRIDVQRSGYAPLDDPDRGRTIQLAEGQTIENLQLQLQKGAVISGRILSPSGEPQADVRVMAMRRIDAAAASAGPRLIPAAMQGPQQTNDLGEFRIAGLAPGEYYVSAAPGGQSPFGGPGVELPAATASRTTTTTYYPGTSDVAAAQPIAVARGAEVGNISFALQAVPAFRVSGVVVDEDGKPVAGAMVMLMMWDPRNGTFIAGPAAGAHTANTGRFTIGNVVAGTYRANASLPIPMNRGAGSVTTWSSAGDGSGGVTIVTGGAVVGAATTAVGGVIHQPVEVVVGDADVTGVRIVVRKPQ